jgi:hypothetical protein
MESEPGRRCALVGCTGWSYTRSFCLRCHEMFARDEIKRYRELSTLPAEEARRRMDDEFTNEQVSILRAYAKEWWLAVRGVDYDRLLESRRG